MGLDTTHDCWHGSYSTFHNFRCDIARALALPFTKDNFGFLVWDSAGLAKEDPIRALLDHSDCDGEIAWEIAGPLADRLEGLISELKGRSAEAAIRFAAGLRKAFATRENVEFH
jgi:hypothetical protein